MKLSSPILSSTKFNAYLLTTATQTALAATICGFDYSVMPSKNSCNRILLNTIDLEKAVELLGVQRCISAGPVITDSKFTSITHHNNPSFACPGSAVAYLSEEITNEDDVGSVLSFLQMYDIQATTQYWGTRLDIRNLGDYELVVKLRFPFLEIFHYDVEANKATREISVIVGGDSIYSVFTQPNHVASS